MTKYIIGEIFSSGGATLYKNPSDQTVLYSIYPQIEDSSHLDFVETVVVMKINVVMKMVEQSVTVIQICVIMSLLSVL